MGSPIFPGIEHIIECGKSRRVHAVVWNPDLRGIESPADDVESIPRDFSAAPEANRPRNALQRSGVASRTLSRRCITKTMEPGTCAQTRDTGYRPFVRNPDEAPAPPNGLAVI